MDGKVKRMVLIGILFLATASLAWPAVILSDLQRRMDEARDGERIPVIVLLKEAPDRAAWERSWDGLDRKARQRAFASAMMNFSRQAQQEIMDILYAEQSQGRAERIRSLSLLNGISARMTVPTIKMLSQRSEVKAIVLSKPIVRNPELPGLRNPGAGGSEPVSPTRGIAWGVQKIGAPTVWAGGNQGQDVIVDVIDTGVDYNHTDLSSRVWINQAEQNGTSGVDDDGNGYIDDIRGWDFADHDNDPMDAGVTDPWAIMQGATPPHGTHVAGTVAGTGAGGQQVGVAPGARIMIGKVFPDTGNGGTLEDLLAAMDYGVANGADIITMSLGFSITDNGDTSQMLKGIMRTECDMIRDAGVILTVAAGNGDPSSGGHFAKPYDIACPGDVPAPWYPETYLHNGDSTGGVITIGATDSNDVIGSFSSRGPTQWYFTLTDTSYTNHFVRWQDYRYNPPSLQGLLKPDVCAPGVKILSCKKGGGYWDAIISGVANWDGTSMATPHVAGLVALMLKANPNLTPAQVDSILEATALPLGAAGKDTVYGSGRVRAPEAVAAAQALGVAGRPEEWPGLSGLKIHCQSSNPGFGGFDLWYNLPAGGRTEVVICNIIGQQVAKPIDEYQTAGRHTVRWNGVDDKGRRVASGVYLAVLKHGQQTASLKLINIR